jgi:flavin reductase (DIM6/NTAB) family NADH-FMN oxidoreductase RutF
MGRFATGVTVVTTTAADGTDHAMTASSFASVSLDPLLVLVCVEKEARFHAAILETGLWGVSVLAEEGRDASTWFATRGRRLEGQLDKVAHERGAHSGAALLCEALTTLECRTVSTHDAGDHTIVVGSVLAVDAPRSDGRPLLYYQGEYRAIGE